ncbi:MAG: hybrid sensor histidine kinase/response regulator [Desulfobacterales bacterium]|nr:hybrid sensor histidine kinase/response regulator [Desulfobacterales bacterium]
MTAEHDKPKILIVDDTPENLDVLQGLLQDDYRIFAAPKGVIALKIAQKQIPDLILLDIMMPEMDGYEVCRRLKVDEVTRDIPIIFITAKKETEDEVKGFEVGGVDYITKPISPPVVIARVKAHLALKREKELLKENMKLKEDVDRITRHDLKTPLNAIINYPKLIDKDNLTEKQVAQLEKINLAGHKLLNMVNLSLDLYKMEQGTYEFMPVPVDILAVLNDVLQENRLFIKSRRATINILLDGEPAAEDGVFEVPGEQLLLYSMLANLMKNALEASPRKETITISMSGDPTPSVQIRNQGVVPEELRDTFFEKYTTSGKKSGTGLGTYSAKLIMDTHGGSISMTSSKETGTTLSVVFSANLPL